MKVRKTIPIQIFILSFPPHSLNKIMCMFILLINRYEVIFFKEKLNENMKFKS